jgi:two-component system, OmpR family, phosphate regulon sensor histidine kinase PhoR
MVKKITTGLIILMGISIVGIIIVQLIWMENALKLRNEQFDRGVTDALFQTVNRLEKIHDVTVISHLAFPDSMSHYSIRQLPPAALRITGIKRNPPYSTSRSDKVFRKRNEEKVTTQVQSVVVFRDDTLKKYDVIFNRGKRALDSINIVMDSSEAFGSAINHKIHVRAQNLRNLAEKAVTEIRVLDNPQIDRLELEKILKEELTDRKIILPYQYGILRDSSLVMSSEKPDTLALLSTSFGSELYPNNIFRKNIRLCLFFPTHDRYIFNSIGWLLGISFLFSMIILLAFSLSVFFLLKQKRISEMKADFINNMTHEFKTPIATISVASDSILDQKVIGDKEKVQYFASMIKKENQRMNRQVEDILTIARLEKKELDFKWENINIHDIISEVSDVIRVQVEQKGGRVLSILESMQPVIKGDRLHFSHMIFNLLDNANKYSPGQPDIKITTTDKDHGICVSVTDKGIGMSRPVQGRIFERFYRQPSGNVHDVKGFGLGLSYVKAVVEAHNGFISVYSEPGNGSTFTLYFSLNQMQNEPTE